MDLGPEGAVCGRDKKRTEEAREQAGAGAADQRRRCGKRQDGNSVRGSAARSFVVALDFERARSDTLSAQAHDPQEAGRWNRGDSASRG